MNFSILSNYSIISTLIVTIILWLIKIVANLFSRQSQHTVRLFFILFLVFSTHTVWYFIQSNFFYLKMSDILLESVMESSSEDLLYPATNLLEGKLWRTAEVGVKEATVVFKLEKPKIISLVSGVNANSSYIEVLGKKSGWPKDKCDVSICFSFFLHLYFYHS